MTEAHASSGFWTHSGPASWLIGISHPIRRFCAAVLSCRTCCICSPTLLCFLGVSQAKLTFSGKTDVMSYSHGDWIAVTLNLRRTPYGAPDASWLVGLHAGYQGLQQMVVQTISLVSLPIGLTLDTKNVSHRAGTLPLVQTLDSDMHVAVQPPRASHACQTKSGCRYGRRVRRSCVRHTQPLVPCVNQAESPWR